MFLYKAISLFSKIKNFTVYKGYLIPKEPTKAPNVEKFYYLQLKQTKIYGKLKVETARSMWKQLSQSERAPYLKSFDQVIQNHHKAKTEYKKLLEILKPSVNGYQSFIQQKFSEVWRPIRFLPMTVTLGKLARLWNDLDEEEKKKFAERSAENKIKKEKQREQFETLRIPSLGRKKDHSKEEMDEHLQELRVFCDRWEISVDDLYKLIQKVKIKELKSGDMFKKVNPKTQKKREIKSKEKQFDDSNQKASTDPQKIKKLDKPRNNKSKNSSYKNVKWGKRQFQQDQSNKNQDKKDPNPIEQIIVQKQKPKKSKSKKGLGKQAKQDKQQVKQNWHKKENQTKQDTNSNEKKKS